MMTFGQLLTAHGVREAVLCPGSRNAPLNLAIARTPGIRSYTAVDERSAAFMAMGMALSSGRPTVVVCTSGTALYDLSPAVAEAYYQGIPLVVISADRPAEWIGQADSQTLRQAGALALIVRRSVDLPVADSRNGAYLNRLLNDALSVATDAPVHINIQISAPDKPFAPDLAYNIIRCVRPAVSASSLSLDPAVSAIVRQLSPPGDVAVYVGGLNPGRDDIRRINRALSLLAAAGVSVIAEFQSGLRDPLFSRSAATVPHTLVSLGGAPVSASMKQFFRDNPPNRHIRLSVDRDGLTDTYLCLTDSVECDPLPFLELWAEKYPEVPVLRHNDTLFRETLPWGEPAVIEMLLNAAKGMDIHISNGMCIRNVQRFEVPEGSRVFCNRGVSGIDGSTSTAVGSAVVSGRDTLLITGDMSFRYDAAALSLPSIPDSMRIAVIDNGGGGIFRMARSTAGAPEREPLFCNPGGPFPAADDYARLFGWRVATASDAAGLRKALGDTSWRLLRVKV